MIYQSSEDSFLLLEQVKKYASENILDLGCGSGIQSLEAAKKGDVLAADINEEAVSHCKNLGLNAIQSDLFANIKQKFDTIIFNPPYLPLEKKEPKESQLSTTGGIKGNEIIEKFLKQAKGHLNENGKILILFSSLTPNVINLFRYYNYKFEKLSEKEIFFETLYVYLLTPNKLSIF